MPEVMDPDFSPSKVGRPPNVDIERFEEIVQANPGQWVAETYPENNAHSARRQFRRRGYEVITAKAKKKGYRIVMVRMVDQ